MFSDPLNLGQIDAASIFDFLYEVFHTDFVANKTYLANTVYINPQSYRKEDNKECCFWHLTTREDKEQVWINGRKSWISNGRLIDYGRASRLGWVKQILTSHDHEQIKLFYHQETNAKKNIRLYLWAHEVDFVVILQKLGKSSSFLVTSFYITHDGKRKEYQQRYEYYCSNTEQFKNMLWF